MQTNINLYNQKMIDSAGMIAAMNQKEAERKSAEAPKVMQGIVEVKREEDLRKENLKRLLNRKKDRTTKSR